MDKILKNIIDLLKGKTVQEATAILFKAMDKIKSEVKI